MTGTLAFRFTVLFALVGFYGCSSSSTNGNAEDKGGSGTGAGSIAGYCEASCAKLHDCDNKEDAQTCENVCANNLAAVETKLRTDFVSYISDCVAARDCVTVLGDDAFDQCADEAVASVAPSAAGQTFCSDLGAALESCNLTNDFDKADCLTSAKTYNDSAIADASACLDKDCSQILDCVDSEFGDVDPSGSKGGGEPSGSGGTSGSGGPGPGKGGSGSTDPLPTGSCTTGTSPNSCVDASTVNVCQKGMYEQVDCTTALAGIGFSSAGCVSNASGDGCVPDTLLDEKCGVGVSAYCTCLANEGSAPCTDDDLESYYIDCFTDETGKQATFYCLNDYVTANTVDCDAAIVCLQ